MLQYIKVHFGNGIHNSEIFALQLSLFTFRPVVHDVGRGRSYLGFIKETPKSRVQVYLYDGFWVVNVTLYYIFLSYMVGFNLILDQTF